MRGRYIKLYDEDQDLLEDVLIEIKQAIEMSSIYLNILSGTMDAFASVISNNLNIVMKVLASITLIISIPTVISRFLWDECRGASAAVFLVPVAFGHCKHGDCIFDPSEEGYVLKGRTKRGNCKGSSLHFVEG